MSWNTALAGVLKKEILLPGCEPVKSDRNLREKDENVDMTVTIAGIGESSAVVDMRRVGHLGCVVDGQWKRKCDYLIFTTTDTGHCVILVELKARLTKKERPFDQLMKTRPIVEYLVSMGRAAGGPSGPVTLRYVLLGQKFDDRLDIQRVKNRPGEPAWVGEYQKERIAVFRAQRIRLADLLRSW